jgi:hypothetical protein
VPHQREEFALAVSEPTPVTLAVDGAGAPETLACQQNAAFKILAHANDAGTIVVSACPEHAARLRTLAAAGPRRFDATLAELAKGAPGIPRDRLRAVGWYSERASAPGGAELHYFPVLLVGHGVIAIPTVVLFKDAQAVVAQAETTPLCGEGGNPLPLCADAKGTLSAIAQRLLK